VSKLNIRATLCGDVLRLARTAGGGTLQRQGLLAIAARASLLVDLAAVGAINDPGSNTGLALDTPGSVRGVLEVDTDPTGCVSADALTSYIRRHPRHTGDRLLRRGRPHLAAVVAELVREGAWVRTGPAPGIRFAHYKDAAAAQFAATYRRIPSLLSGQRQPVDTREAALAAIADVLGLCGHRDLNLPVSPRMAGQLGHVTWLGVEVADYLRTVQIHRAAATEAGDGGG
jgi:hypothetical protein